MKSLLPIVVIIIASSLTCLGQPNPPGPPNGGNNPGVPITGIEWLLIAGGLLGGKKALQSFRNRKLEN